MRSPDVTKNLLHDSFVRSKAIRHLELSLRNVEVLERVFSTKNISADWNRRQFTLAFARRWNVLDLRVRDDKVFWKIRCVPNPHLLGVNFGGDGHFSLVILNTLYNPIHFP